MEQAELLRELRESLEEEEDTELQLSGTKTLRLTPSGNYGLSVINALYYNHISIKQHVLGTNAGKQLF